MNNKYDAIVIGAGIGGLSTAAFLAKNNLAVLVLEKHYKPGGYTHSFQRKGFTFDSAVRIVAGAKEPGVLFDLLRKLDIDDKLNFIELTKIYRVIYPDDDVMVHRSINGIIEAYVKLFPIQKDNILGLVEEMQSLYKCTIELLNSNDPMAVLTDTLYMKYRNISFAEMLKSFLTDKKLIEMFSALWGYYGVIPAEGSAIFFSYAIMSYFMEGIYYLEGSFQKLSQVLVNSIRKNNGNVLLKKEVTKIITDIEGVSSVECADGEIFRARKIVANCSLETVLKKLLGQEELPARYIKKIDSLEKSLSAFEVFIGTDLPLQEMGLPHETFVYDSYDNSQIYHSLLDIKDSPFDIKGYSISCPSLVDPSLCPEGKHTLIITTLVPFHNEKGWKDLKSEFAQYLIDKASKVIPGLAEHILVAEYGSPETMQRYTGNSEGAIYGWKQNLKQFTNRPQQNTPIKGLYLAGHWTDPGGGVVSTFLSGYKLSNKILNERSE